MWFIDMHELTTSSRWGETHQQTSRTLYLAFSICINLILLLLQLNLKQLCPQDRERPFFVLCLCPLFLTEDSAITNRFFAIMSHITVTML
jgi:hypothetical protein